MYTINTALDSQPDYPIPISRLGHRYYLYDIEHITHLRVTHHMLGTLVGTLPQSPQQNLFLGLPLELTPEEARLLISKGVCRVVEDVAVHRSGLKTLTPEERKKYKNSLQAQGKEAAAQAVRLAGLKTESAVGRLDEKRREKALKALKKSKGTSTDAVTDNIPDDEEANDKNDAETLFSTAVPKPAGSRSSLFSPTPSQLEAHGITPTTSYPPLPTPVGEKPRTPISSPTPASHYPSPPSTPPFNAATLPFFSSSTTTTLPTHTIAAPPSSTPAAQTEPLASPTPPPKPTTILPPAPPSYPLFAHLHSLSYFMSPGLRFGCQYCVYPGDPLRFHSHFLAVGMEWDEEMDLLTLVGGGRLGTGVKKGFLLGGVERRDVKGGVGRVVEEEEEDMSDGEGVRCFCVEWGGM